MTNVTKSEYFSGLVRPEIACVNKLNK